VTGTQVELVLDARNATGESPVWCVAEQALYWVDIPARKLFRMAIDGDEVTQWDAPEMLGCISQVAPIGPGPNWIAGAETGIFLLVPGPGGQLGFKRLAAVDHAMPGMRFNDGRCDRQGRFLAGTMMMNMAPSPRSGCVYSYQKSSGLTQLLDGFITPNGMAFSPDGRTMYLSDSHPSVQLVWAFDYDIDSGTPSNRRLFIDMNPLPGRPDGAAIDQDGCYWICGNDAGFVHRFTPEGKLDRSLPVPVKKPAMCAFGGAGLDTLFVTSIRPEGIDLSDQPLAGGVFALYPGVRGLPEPAFAA
jgi:sugar lactone lactonase YvrE